MSIYQELGIKPYINALDTVSIFGGSRMPDHVMDAMHAASRNFVELADLEEKTGRRIAELSHNEGAYITAGASSGLLYCASLLVTGGDPELLKLLPDTSSMAKNELIMMAGQRTGYDKALQCSGAKVIVVDAKPHDTQALEAAINDRTAGIFFFDLWGCRDTSLSFEDTMAVANRHNVPVVVDAAAQLPPIENLWRFTGAGAAAAVFSGGKGMRGPQGSGLVVGKKWLLDGFPLVGAPKHGIGRSSKIGREEIVGLYTAIRDYLEPGMVDCKVATIEARVQYINEALNKSGLFRCKRVFPGPTGQCYPRSAAELMVDVPAEELVKVLREGTPGILICKTGPDTCTNGIFINPLLLTDDEVSVVVREIIAQTRVLQAAR